jgi:hypothetical protein
MPTILKTKNSVTTTVVPTTLQQGELAVNITDKKLWVGNAATTPVQLLGAGVTGDVVGPASATDNAISRFDATTGKLIQNSLVTVSDTGAISAPVDASISGLTVGKGAGAVSTNTAVGASALAANEAGGTNNTAIGNAALDANTTGDENTAVGSDALGANTTASNNTAVGYVSSYSNTTGTNLVSVGRYSLYGNTTGGNNTAIGHGALEANTTASNNTAVGYQAGYANTTGADNTFFGRQAGLNVTTGSANTCIGSLAGTDAVFNITTENNRIVLGYNAITNAYIKVAWTVTSDARDKTNFAEVPHGLDFVTKLKPLSYQFKASREDDTPTGNVRYGFLAQDIMALEGDKPVIIDNENEENLKYQGESLVPVLVKAIQELKAEFDAYKATHP